MTTWRSTEAAVAVSFLMFSSPSLGAIVPTAATQACLDANPGLRAMVKGERLTALYGVSFATDNDPLTTTDDFVNNFLAVQANVDALGVDGAVLELKDKITIRNGKFTVYTYRQRIENLPVHGSIVKIPVLLGPTEKISYIGMRLIQHPVNPLPPDVLTAADAIAIVQQSPTYGHLTNFTAAADAQKVVYEDRDQVLHRTWRFSGWDDDEAYQFFVDTSSEEIVGVVNMVVEAGVEGTVSGYGTPCTPADHPTCINCCYADGAAPPDSDPDVMPMSGVQVTIAGQPVQYADDSGGYLFSGLAPGQPVTVESRLIGQWVTVIDAQGPDLVEAANVTPADPPAIANLVFNPAEQTEFGTAQVNAFLTVQDTHDWFKDLQPSSVAIDKNLFADVNVPSQQRCTLGGYNFIAQRMTLKDGNTRCRNGATPTIISHEYGHFILNQLLDVLPEAFHEGTSDAVAALKWNTELLGLGSNKPESGLPDPVRDLDDDVRLDMSDPLPTWCSGSGSVHCRGVALAGVFWDLRKKMLVCAGGVNNGQPCHPDANCPGGTCNWDRICDGGDNTGQACDRNSQCGVGGVCTNDLATEELFADFLFITDGGLDESVLVEVLVADDDDGDLTTPSLYQAEIMDTFTGTGLDQHGWSDLVPLPGDNSVVVKWEGPIGDPVTDQPDPNDNDYVVHFEVSPPNVTLLTTKKGGFDVLSWFVGRVDANGDPLDLGAITANWALPSDLDITVEVGTDPAPPCRNVNVVEIPPQSPTNWSSIVLQVGGRCNDVNAAPCNTDNDCAPGVVCTTGDVVGRAQCNSVANAQNPNFGNGGLISGTVSGWTGRIVAAGVGVEEPQLGSLSVRGGFHRATFSTIPPQQTLETSRVGNALEVSGELRGTIHFQGDFAGSCASEPNVVCFQGITDCPTLDVCFPTFLTVSGTGLSDGDILVDGTIGPGVTITVAGNMSGNISWPKEKS